MKKIYFKLILISILFFLILTSSFAQTAKQLYEQGQALLSEKDYAEAVNKFEEAVKKDPGNLLYLNGLGEAYYYTNEFGKGIEVFEQVKSKALPLVSYYFYGMSLLKSGRADDAIAAFEELKKFKKTARNLALADQGLGLCYFEKKDLNKSEEYFKSSANNDPLLPKNHLYLGRILLNRNEFLKAEEEFRIELQIPSDDLDATKAEIASILVDYGMKLINEGKLKEGEDMIQSSGKYDSTVAKNGLIQAYTKEADILISSGKKNEAREKLLKAIELDPANQELQTKLSSVKGNDLMKYIPFVGGGILGVIILFVIIIIIVKASKKKPASTPAEVPAPAPGFEEDVPTEVIQGEGTSAGEEVTGMVSEKPMPEISLDETKFKETAGEPVSEEEPSPAPEISVTTEEGASLKDILAKHLNDPASVEKVKNLLIENPGHIDGFKYLSKFYIDNNKSEELSSITGPFVIINNETKELGTKVLEFAMKKISDIRPIAGILNNLYIQNNEVEKAVMLNKRLFDEHLESEVNNLKNNLKKLLELDKKNIKIHYLFYEIYKFTKEEKMMNLEKQIIDKLKAK
ncbi:MAG: tetratricopeptide repeat protein [bacterium]|nr:tetratricopeptide repeat protein [bacterium]